MGVFTLLYIFIRSFILVVAVMEGFLTWKIHPVYRRLLTRLVAIVPAVVVTAAGGDNDDSANNLLIWSQVILSFALPFAIVPLVSKHYQNIGCGSIIRSPYHRRQ